MSGFRPKILFLGGAVLTLLAVALLFNLVVMPLYTRHGQVVELPDVQTLDLDQALQKLLSRKLRPVVRSRRFSMQSQETVIYQSPQPGITVKPGRRIYLDVSRGPSHLRIPDLAGLSYRQAGITLSGLGLSRTAQKFHTRFDSLAPPGVVVDQYPPPGDSLAPGDSLQIWISLGKLREFVSVPRVLRATEEQAREKIFLSGLQVCRVEKVYYAGVTPRQVVDLDPPAGSPLLPGACVKLIVTVSSPDSVQMGVRHED